MTIILSSTSASATGITNYGELKTAVAEWMNRSDLTDRIPSFVRLAETSIRRDVRTRAQEVLLDTTNAAQDTIDVPELMLELRRFSLGGKKKTYLTPEQWTDDDDANKTGDHFTVIGQSIYVLGGADSASYALLYWQSFEAFVDDNDNNWLILNAPEVYLYPAIREAALFMKDYETAQVWDGKYQGAVALLNASEKSMRYSAATLRVRTDSSAP